MTHPILWQASPERKQASALACFQKHIEAKTQQTFADYQELHAWSVKEWQEFWRECESFLEFDWVKPPMASQKIFSQSGSHVTSGHWFPGTKLNYAANILRAAGQLDEAVSSFDEDGIRHRLSGEELAHQVHAVQLFLQAQGVKEGDRVAGVVANGSEALIAFLATASLGAIWASCSPDFGEQAILDRFEQIGPKILFYTATYKYGGKTFDCTDKINRCLKTLTSVKMSVAIDASTELHFTWQDLLAQNISLASGKVYYASVDFDHPLYILFSSGTTGKPKCIVHAHGRSLLQHRKEHVLHCDLKPRDKIFYFTTCGWMMWNWLVSALASQGSIVLYDGSPSSPQADMLWRIVDREGVAIFGTSPRFLQFCESNEVLPGKQFSLTKLKTILSTGSPLAATQFDWIYEKVKSDVHLASISGGTDIVACFVLGNILSPVRRSEIQGAGLGMAVEVWDENGQRVYDQKGELVCTKPFVSMPVGFWHDPQQKRYKASYFEKFANVWCHGDFITQSRDGGFVIWGRSDATLNPGGVRIGTAELYSVVESMAGIRDSLAIAQEMTDDLRIILFLQLSDPKLFDEGFVESIKTHIRNQLSPRHVPQMVKVVSGIPYTRSGKKMEIAVKNIMAGQAVDNKTAIANPEVLADYEAIAKSL